MEKERTVAVRLKGGGERKLLQKRRREGGTHTLVCFREQNPLSKGGKGRKVNGWVILGERKGKKKVSRNQKRKKGKNGMWP